MENQNIKLSIIMPLNNCSKWLVKCLDSIPKRDDIEVIMVENGSTDSTKKICENYINNNQNWKLILFNEPIGCASAINAGLDKAVGDYILQLDGDDYLFTDVINELLNSDLKDDLIYFNLIDNQGHVWKLTPENCANLPDHTSLIKRTFLGKTRMPVSSEDRFNPGHGWFMFKELLSKQHTAVFTNKVMYYYNFPREGSIYWNATHK